MDEKICEIRNRQVAEQLKNHEERIEKLEDTYSLMQKMDCRIENVEGAVTKVEKAVEKIDNKISMKVEEKGKKWDKLIDYLFYAVLACLLGYIAYQLGLKG